MPSAHVLYVDHQGHPAPLACSYHATASRRLSSSIDRFPPSTLTEIDSAYCPQCLSFHDVGSAASLANCPLPQCRRCPLCTAIAPVSIDKAENQCFYKCGYCSWSSKECDIVAALSLAEDGSVGRQQISLAAEELGTAIRKRIVAGDDAVEKHFNTMVDSWGKLAEEEVRRQKQGGVVTGRRRGLDTDGPEGWSIDTLEEDISKKREKAREEATTTVGDVTIHKLSLEESEVERDVSLENVSQEALTLQAMVTAATPRSRRDLLPLPIPLRARKSRRCRAELADGRPGILVKPKLNPLEGDSSLRTGHGQWWKKDSSAIHVVPRVQVVRFGSDSEGKRHAFLFKVLNPTLGIVRLRFSASAYQGELEFDGDGRVKRIDNLLVDVIGSKRIDVMFNDSTITDLPPTEPVELNALKDAFLELGKAQQKDPPEVENWKADGALNDSNSKQENVRFVAKENDTAWFEFVAVTSTREEENVYFGAPVRLDIQVGEGSWESSLVRPLAVEDGKQDYVQLDLVIAWQPSST